MSIAAKLNVSLSHPLEPLDTLPTQPLLPSKPLNNDHEISFQADFPEVSSITKTRNDQQQLEFISRIDDNTAKFYPSPLPQYDPNKTPPDFQQVNRHRLAHKIYSSQEPSPEDPLCESTGIPLHQQGVKLSCKLSELFHIGPVVPMYFLFLKHVAFMFCLLSLVTLIIGFSQYNLLLFEHGSFIATIKEDIGQTSSLVLLTIFTTILLFVILHIFRYKQKLTKLACKKTVITPSDYTVMSSGMGRIHLEDEVRRFFSDYIVSGFSLDIFKVTMTYNVEKYVDEARKVQECLRQKRQLQSSPNPDMHHEALNNLDRKIANSNIILNDSKKKLQDCLGLKRNGLAFITYNTKQEAKTVRRKFEMSVVESFAIQLLQAMTEDYPQFFFKQHFVTIEKAPELHEVIWENLNCNAVNKVLGVISATLVLFIILITCLSLYVLKSYDSALTIWVFGIIIILTNEALSFTIRFLAAYEKFKTITQKYLAIGFRITVTQFFNMAAPLLVNNIGIYTTSIETFSHDVLIIAIITFTMPIVIRAINPQCLYKGFQRGKLQAQGPSCLLPQAKVEHIFEDPEFSVPELYADCIKNLLFSCLYFTVCPIISIIGLLSVLSMYWVEKYNLLRRSVLPSSLRSEIAEAMFEFVDFGVFLLMLGCYGLLNLEFESINGTMTDEENGILIGVSLFALILSFIYMILPNRRLNRVWFANRRPRRTRWTDELLYQQANDYFLEDYFTMNPVYRDKELSNQMLYILNDTKEEFKDIQAIQELPKLLAIFEYAANRPSLRQIWRNNMKGLENPYYSFPQNYGYGTFYVGSGIDRPPKSFMYKKSAHAKASFLVRNSPKTRVSPSKEQGSFKFKLGKQSKEQEMDVMNGRYSENKERDAMNNTPGASMMKEWSLFFNQNLKGIDDYVTSENITPRDTMSNIPGAFGGEMNNDKIPSLSSLSYIKSPSIYARSPPIHGRSIGPGLSPIMQYAKRSNNEKRADKP